MSRRYYNSYRRKQSKSRSYMRRRSRSYVCLGLRFNYDDFPVLSPVYSSPSYRRLRKYECEQSPKYNWVTNRGCIAKSRNRVVEGLKQHYSEYQRLKSEYLKSEEAKCKDTSILHLEPVSIDIIEQLISIPENEPINKVVENEESIDAKNIEYVYQNLSDIDKLSVNEIITMLLQEYKKETNLNKQQNIKKELVSYGYTF